MVRRFASDLMELTALVLFFGTVLIWAQVLSG
jgi:hypothetical protein